MTKFKVNKKVMLEGLGLGSSGTKTYASKPQEIIVSEAQLSRLLEMTRDIEEESFEQIVPGDQGPIGEDDGIFDEFDDMGSTEDADMALESDIRGLIHKTRLQELEMIVGDVHSLIREAIVTERISGLNRRDYILTEQGMYDRNPGIAAAEGIENVINGIKKAYDYVKDPTTKKKIWNTLTKLNNFMTVTAELIGSGASQRRPRPASQISSPLPYPEIEVPEELEDIDDELHEQTTSWDGGMAATKNIHESNAVVRYPEGTEDRRRDSEFINWSEKSTTKTIDDKQWCRKYIAKVSGLGYPDDDNGTVKENIVACMDKHNIRIQPSMKKRYSI